MTGPSTVDFTSALEGPLRAKAARLLELLHEMGGLVVAFSGGVDSALLCAAGYRVLGDRLLAVTVRSQLDTPEDHENAVAVALQIGCNHRVVDFDDLATPRFAENPPDRCYHCKLARFRAILDIASEWSARAGCLAQVAEGSNADDAHAYRPGARAVAELGIRSPLAEAGLTKPEIRALARALGLPVWDRPSAPCLATRFPYGTEVTVEGLSQVARGEAFLKALGYRPVRVRHFGDTARLEVDPARVADLAARREELLAFFKSLGFTYVMVDLAGYRSGSMDEVLKT